MPDDYAAAASAYDIYAAASRPAQGAALAVLHPKLRPLAGPILDVGAGSGANTGWILANVPDATVLAIEPSAAMRALAIGRIAAHPDWFSRVTVRPEDFFAAPLPDRIGGAVLLGVLGHFDPEERAAVLAELAVRLHPESAALIDLQAPETPTLIEPFAFTAAQIGDLTYRGIAEAWPDGGERMRWRMTYLTLEDERVLAEEVNEYIFHHPAPSTVASEAASLGLRLDPAGEPSFWLLSRAGDSAEDAR